MAAGALKSEELKQVPVAPTPLLEPAVLRAFVERFIEARESYLGLRRLHGSPLYVFEEAPLLARAARFRAAFEAVLDEVDLFFAMKANNHPFVSATLVKAGYGLDVSSGTELVEALAHGPEHILFSGPGKTAAELERAVRAGSRVTVLMDSFGELERLARAASRQRAVCRVGVRLTTDESGLWRKFGIPLRALGRFMALAETCPNVDLRGLQFHTSWNRNADTQAAFIRRLGKTLATLGRRKVRGIRFLDIGGGYWPERGEWLHAAPGAGAVRNPLDHVNLPAQPIEEFAGGIAEALREHIFPLLSCRIHIEPGRWVCDDAMHILLTVVDKKGDNLVIVDTGTNALGWERMETDYCPVLNLSRPSHTERKCLILGSLCTPHDVWGYSYFGESMRVGDVLLVPAQGAYTYSLRQRFIKPLPKTAIMHT